MARRASRPETNATTNPDAVAACYAEYAGLMADQGRLGAKIGAMFNRFEKSDAVDKKSIQNIYKLATKDPAEAKRRLDRDKEYALICGLTEEDSDGQVGMSEAIAPRVAKPSPSMQAQLVRARAHTDGYNSGKAGGPVEGAERHAAGSEEYVAWREGWADGYADRIMRKPELANVTKAEPRPRGRPKKKAAPPAEPAAEPIDQTDLEEHIANAATASVH